MSAVMFWQQKRDCLAVTEWTVSADCFLGVVLLAIRSVDIASEVKCTRGGRLSPELH